MKKRIVMGVALCLALLPFTLNAQVVQSVKVLTAQTANINVWTPTSSGVEAQVNVRGTGLVDGTVTLYVCPERDTNTCVIVATHPTPTTAKTYVGTSSAFLYTTLSANTAGTVDVVLTVKR